MLIIDEIITDKIIFDIVKSEEGKKIIQNFIKILNKDIGNNFINIAAYTCSVNHYDRKNNLITPIYYYDSFSEKIIFNLFPNIKNKEKSETDIIKIKLYDLIINIQSHIRNEKIANILN